MGLVGSSGIGTKPGAGEGLGLALGEGLGLGLSDGLGPADWPVGPELAAPG